MAWFTTQERGTNSAGLVTGELRSRTEPVVKGLRELAACELNFGYSLVNGSTPQHADTVANDCAVVLRSPGGNSAVINPVTRAVLDAQLEPPELQIDGDHLTGKVAFRLKSAAVQSGRYQFVIEASIDDDRFGGFWRGDLDGQPILTKSSKVGGVLLPAK
jgi:hypothetical protein